MFPDTATADPKVGLVTRSVSARAFEPLRERPLEWRRRIEMVEASERFLYASTYYIEGDAYGLEFLEALLRARRRGVHVVFVLDSFGQRLGGIVMNAQRRLKLATALQALQEAGGLVCTYRPRQWLARRLGAGHHVKIQLSDKGEALFGSSNITASSYERWEEFSAVLSGPVVLPLLDSFVALGVEPRPQDRDHLRGGRADGPSPLLFDYALYNPSPAQGFSGPLGWKSKNTLSLGLERLLAQARESIVLTSFYFKPTPSLLRTLLGAARRGVRVEICHSHLLALPETRLTGLAACADYDALLAAGVVVHENLSGEHSKVVVIDGKLGIFGSYNFEHAADDRLAEAMLVSHDASVVNALVEVWKHAVSLATPVETSWRRNLSPSLRLGARMVRPFKRWV